VGLDEHVGSIGEVFARIGTYRGVRGEGDESDTGEAASDVVEEVDKSVVLRLGGLTEDIALVGVE